MLGTNDACLALSANIAGWLGGFPQDQRNLVQFCSVDMNALWEVWLGYARSMGIDPGTPETFALVLRPNGA